MGEILTPSVLRHHAFCSASLWSVSATPPPQLGNNEAGLAAPGMAGQGLMTPRAAWIGRAKGTQGMPGNILDPLHFWSSPLASGASLGPDTHRGAFLPAELIQW